MRKKTAGTYLRLNGFLHLPLFTLFCEDKFGQVDFIALRGAESVEKAMGNVFPVDEAFFAACSSETVPRPKDVFLGAVAEVRTNEDEKIPDDDDVYYARSFLGNVPVISLAFSDCRDDPVKLRDGVVAVGLDYAMKWIEIRIAWMEKHGGSFTKSGSWTLSEDALSDILVRLKRQWGEKK